MVGEPAHWPSGGGEDGQNLYLALSGSGLIEVGLDPVDLVARLRQGQVEESAAQAHGVEVPGIEVIGEEGNVPF
jgi:hypothetical protein